MLHLVKSMLQLKNLYCKLKLYSNSVLENVKPAFLSLVITCKLTNNEKMRLFLEKYKLLGKLTHVKNMHVKDEVNFGMYKYSIDIGIEG